MASHKGAPDRSGASRESRNGHFGDGVHQVTIAAAAQRSVHNGMNDHKYDIPRFGADEADIMPGWGKFDRGAWDGPSHHDRVMGDTDD